MTSEINSKMWFYWYCYFKYRDSDLHQQWAKIEAVLEYGKAVLECRDKRNKFGVECPYCHAANVKKITNTSKAVHIAIFGIFSLIFNLLEPFPFWNLYIYI